MARVCMYKVRILGGVLWQRLVLAVHSLYFILTRAQRY